MFLAVLVTAALPRVAAAEATASFPPAGGAPVAPAPSEPAAPPASGSPSESRYPRLPSPAPAAPAGSAAPPARPPTATSALYPALLPYREGLPVPPGYHVEHRPAQGLIVGGLASLIIGYGTAVIVGAGSGFKDGTGWLVLPVLGPWAAIGARSYQCDNDPLHANACVHGAFNEVQTIAILSADAVVQATGAVLFLAGLGSGSDELVRTDGASVRVTPRAVGRDGFGLGFDGRF